MNQSTGQVRLDGIPVLRPAVPPWAFELRHLRYFVAVAEELHFGRAAERLHIAQPALSQQIRRLESALSVQLLLRDSRNVKLTAAGVAFLDASRRTLAEASRGAVSAQIAQDGALRSLRIDVGQTAGSTAWEILRAVRTAQPESRLEVSRRATPRQVSGLLDGTLDAALSLTGRLPPQLHSQVVRVEPPALLVDPGHVLAGRGTVSLEEVGNEPLVAWDEGGEAGWHAEAERLLRSVGAVPGPVSAVAEGCDVAAQLVHGTASMMLVPASLAQDARGLVALTLTPTVAPVRWSLVWRAEAEDSPAVAALRGAARDAGRHLAWLPECTAADTAAGPVLDRTAA